LRGERGTAFWVQLALLAIAANAVLIQTLVTEDSSLKDVIRVSVLLVTVFVMYMRRTVVPGWTVALAILCRTLCY